MYYINRFIKILPLITTVVSTTVPLSNSNFYVNNYIHRQLKYMNIDSA